MLFYVEYLDSWMESLVWESLPLGGMTISLTESITDTRQ